MVQYECWRAEADVYDKSWFSSFSQSRKKLYAFWESSIHLKQLTLDRKWPAIKDLPGGGGLEWFGMDH